MSPEQFKKYLDIIKNIASPSMLKIYEVYVRYQLINGVVTLILAILILSLVIFLGKKGVIKAKIESPDTEIIEFICLMILFGVCVGCVIWGTHGVLQLANPDYYAIKDLINEIKP
mgnify:CR=1 FL=1